jgi:hypothetical protein
MTQSRANRTTSKLQQAWYHRRLFSFNHCQKNPMGLMTAPPEWSQVSLTRRARRRAVETWKPRKSQNKRTNASGGGTKSTSV